MVPIFGNKFYGPLFGSLENAGLIKDQTYFIFGYDFRKSVQTSASWLNDFLENEVLLRNPGKKINIASHRMGGLVARYCVEKIVGCSGKIDKIVTGGTPHWGLNDAYQFWAGLEAHSSDFLINFGEKFILRLVRNYQSDPVTHMQTNFPGVRDLLPVVQYIYNKPYASLHPIDKNLTIEQLFDFSAQFISSVRTLSGTKINTDSLFVVKDPNQNEQSKGLWLDGKPTRTYAGEGDDTVLITSSEIPASSAKYYAKLHHSDYFRDRRSIKDTLEWFNLSSIIPSPLTTNTPVLIMVFSPNIQLQSSPGLQSGGPQAAFIDNPNKKFKVKFTGRSSGNYLVETFIFAYGQEQERQFSGSIGQGEEKEIDLQND